MPKSASEVVLLGAGDIGPVHAPIDQYSTLVQPTLATADIRFGNCERQYSRRGVHNYQSPHGCQPPEMAKIFTDCGFDALSLANNHMLDFGIEPMLDTRALMIEKGIQVTGAGKNIEEARQPAIVERNGVRVAFLAYSSVFPPKGEAGPNTPGLAPLRVKTYHEMREVSMPPKVVSFAWDEDLKAILSDIAAARRKADIVVLSLHWGVIWIPRIIADYQPVVAHAAIDAGADLILGHHAHVPKAIEVYKGKVCFYSLSNFCMTKPFPNEAWSEPVWSVGSVPSYTELDPEYPLLPYGKDGKRSLLARAVLSKKGISRVSFLPMMIDKKYRPEVLHHGDSRFDDAVKYMDWTSDGFKHRFSVEGDEVVIGEP